MSLDEALRDITQRITCVPWDNDENRPAWQAPTGEAYIEFFSGGVRKDGEAVPCLCATVEQAVDAWRLAVLDYSTRNPGIIYWRVAPEITKVKAAITEVDGVEFGGNEAVRYYVYSRLLVSSRSVVRSVKRPA